MIFSTCLCHSVERQKVSITHIKRPADYDRYILSELCLCLNLSGSEFIKLFYMLNSTEHEILTAHRK